LASKPSRSEWTYLSIRRFGKAVPAPSRPRWRFNADAREQLLRILGNRPDLIERLEHAVSPSGHKHDPDQTLLWDRGRGRRVAQYQRLHRAVRELRKALAVLDWHAGLDIETAGDGEYAYDNNCGEPDLNLVWFDDAAEELEKVTRWLSISRKHKRPGRPNSTYDLLRWMLAQGVGVELDCAGIPLTKGRDGVFARTLAVVLDSAGFRVPEDLFPLVRRIATSVAEKNARLAAKGDAGLVMPKGRKV
jgi:hypothetical protein